MLGIAGNGDFVFPTPVPLTVYSYGIGIEQQPHSPTQRCVVSSFAIAATNVANVGVSCKEFSYVTDLTPVLVPL